MKKFLVIFIVLSCIIGKTAAQQNWAAIPCFDLKYGDAISRVVVNEVQDELILGSSYSFKICNSTYKSFFAFNGATFNDMDFGIEAQNPNHWLSAPALGQCIEWKGNALITGNFSTVGSDTLPAKYIAKWNGSTWDNFPHPFWSNTATQNFNTSFGMGKLLKDNDKLWMFTGYDTAGTSTYIPVLYDGQNFTPMPQIPVNNKNQVIQAVKYRNKIVVTGNFLNYPSLTYFRLAQFDGTSWSEIGNGAPGNLTGVAELTVYNDTLYIAGNFSKSDGCKGNYIMKWDGNQLSDAGFGDFCDYGPVRKLIPFRNRLYAFGGFNCAANQKAFGVAYYENGTWTVPKDSINNGVYDAVLYKDAIYIGGQFESINGDSTLRKFVRLECPDFDAASGCLSSLKESFNNLDIKIFPNPSNDKIYVEFDRSISINKISISNTLGQEVFKISKPLPKQEIALSNLPDGIYFLRVENKSGQRVFKLVKG